MTNESCATCTHCHELYIAPTMKSKEQHLKCCTLFYNEKSIMFLQDTNGQCECYQEVGEENA